MMYEGRHIYTSSFELAHFLSAAAVRCLDRWWMNVDAVLPDRHSSYSIWKSLCSSMHTLRNLTLITLCQTIDGKILPIHYSYCENYFITFTTRAQPKKLLDALVPSALMSTYALPKSHQDVSIVPSASWAPKHGITVLTHYTTAPREVLGGY